MAKYSQGKHRPNFGTTTTIEEELRLLADARILVGIKRREGPGLLAGIRLLVGPVSNHFVLPPASGKS
jgi:hypothetical protein